VIKEHKTIIEELKTLALNDEAITYDDTLHIPLLIEVIGNGSPVSAFAAQAHISRKTFYEWLKKHPKFKRAYERALPEGESVFVNIPLQKPELPFPYWHIRMRNQYQYGKKCVVDSMNSDSALERLKGARLTFVEGELGISEYAQLVGTIVTEIKASELARSLDEATLDGLKDIKTMNKEELNERINVLIRSLECKG